MENLVWPGTKDASVPSGCIPCRLCKGYCMKAETVEPDWHGRGKVIRIFSMCDKSFDFPNEFVRTEFDTAENAVIEWNSMN